LSVGAHCLASVLRYALATDNAAELDDIGTITVDIIHAH
jgi:hypothetical protein